MDFSSGPYEETPNINVALIVGIVCILTFGSLAIYGAVNVPSDLCVVLGEGFLCNYSN